LAWSENPIERHKYCPERRREIQARTSQPTSTTKTAAMAEPSNELKLADSATLAMLGKKQVLKRRFAFISLFGFAVCELITWETVLALFSQALDNGGPAGAVYGFIIAWFSTMSVYTVISELASLAPIAGGQ
jgi:choline transport protein